MDNVQFNDVFRRQMLHCKALLVHKGREYVPGVAPVGATGDDTRDRLIQFKLAAHLQNETPEEALAGMMAKHTTSIYSMVMETGQGVHHPLETWAEKVTDHINYLVLLMALVTERFGNPDNPEL
jgi:hypothetical protein